MRIEQELVQIGLQPRNRAHLFAMMSELLVRQGYVTEGFCQDVEEREHKYPTGLQPEGGLYAFAIPHAHSGCVLRDGICIATLKDPVEFGRLDDPEQTVRANIIFMLASKDSQLHLELLRDIVRLFGNESFAQGMVDAKTPEALVAHITREVEARRREEMEEEEE